MAMNITACHGGYCGQL